MLKVKTCLSIVWDKDYLVYGALLSKRGKKFTLLNFSSCIDKNRTFAQRLSEVYKKLGGDNSERVVLGGFVPNALIFSLDIPNLKPTEIKKFLDFEISRYIPENPEDYAWTFRPILYPGADKNKIEKIKIIALYKSVADEIAKSLIESGMKFDAILHPFFVIDPLYTAFDLYLETIDDKFYSRASIEQEGWFMSELPKDETQKQLLAEETNFAFHRFESMLKESLKYFIPSIILAEYSLSRTFDIERKNFFPVPPSCKPKRFKLLKLGAVAAFAVFLFLAGFYICRESIDNYRLLDSLKNQLASLKTELNDIKRKASKEKTTNDYIQLTLTSEPDDIDALNFLDYLSKITPKDVWANYLNTYGNSANLTMQTTGNSDALISELYRSPEYTLQNSRKNKSSDGSEYIYISLVKKSKDNSDYLPQ
ncbi:MAG TPA: hypothetical protein DD381_03185 [Lentisphaeria bacterium]|nr:MAG: hypothetical protein A2X47_03065 [Lentisphaerae bacterium GWF2_38_69]HBM15337.1 hypothetical protein [Lentisphaeria bacterium]